ncbi:MAG: hypothetical protein M1G31_34545 [Pseudanabaena sp. Salubria-1]|nr:hypothetical protein [Pseudanabaena sp. Salubria-1]
MINTIKGKKLTTAIYSDRKYPIPKVVTDRLHEHPRHRQVRGSRLNSQRNRAPILCHYHVLKDINQH